MRAERPPSEVMHVLLFCISVSALLESTPSGIGHPNLLSNVIYITLKVFDQHPCSWELNPQPCRSKHDVLVNLQEHFVNPGLCVGSLIPECHNAFALVVRPPTEQENLLFSFQLMAEDTLKSAWLKTLCRQVANTICRADMVRAHTHRQKHSHFLLRSSPSGLKPNSIIYFISSAFFLL